MKITGIHINDYQQFNDFHLDLTYPKGHEKEGKPLDKVCFIGQSGTGKTTLLNMIKKLLCENLSEYNENWTYDDYNFKISCIGEIPFTIQNNRELSKNILKVLQNKYKDKLGLIIKEISLINFPSEIIESFNIKDRKIEDPFQFIKTEEEINGSVIQERKKLKDKKIHDFGKESTIDIWKSILLDAKDYMIEDLKFSQQITKSLTNKEKITNSIIQSYNQWKNNTINPFKEISNVLGPIIEKFFVRVKSDFNFEKAEDLDFIKLETLKGAIVPTNIWSTGTKQVILTAIPIYKLDTNKTVILIDEPERSLYPDIQQEIIGYYTQLARKAQFFFATHSPIIASSFEPWEIVELKFDYEKGIVSHEKYYDGERDIKNYFINPQYLRWDSILTKVFDLKERGNEKRIEKLMELAAIGKKIEKESSKSKKTEIYKEYKKLSELLDWETK